MYALSWWARGGEETHGQFNANMALDWTGICVSASNSCPGKSFMPYNNFNLGHGYTTQKTHTKPQMIGILP
jgi:hypothetical protein